MNTESGPVLKLLPEERVRKIIDIGDVSLKERENIYKSILIHEGFHCYQMENGMKTEIFGKDNSEDMSSENEEIIKFKNLLIELDNENTYRDLWTTETESLIKFYNTNNKTDWIKNRNERIEFEKSYLKENYPIYKKLANQTELIEGTARYLENISLAIRNDSKPNDNFESVYSNDIEKFYQSGCIKSFILDKTNKDWKDLNFNGSITLKF